MPDVLSKVSAFDIIKWTQRNVCIHYMEQYSSSSHSTDRRFLLELRQSGSRIYGALSSHRSHAASRHDMETGGVKRAPEGDGRAGQEGGMEQIY